jgi:hypothetical protein
MFNWKRNRKRDHSLILDNVSENAWNSLEKEKRKKLCQASQCHGQNSKRATPMYKSEANSVREHILVKSIS